MIRLTKVSSSMWNSITRSNGVPRFSRRFSSYYEIQENVIKKQAQNEWNTAIEKATLLANWVARWLGDWVACIVRLRLTWGLEDWLTCWLNKGLASWLGDRIFKSRSLYTQCAWLGKNFFYLKFDYLALPETTSKTWMKPCTRYDLLTDWLTDWPTD